MLKLSDEDVIACLIKHGEIIKPMLYLISDNIEGLTSNNIDIQRKTRCCINDIMLDRHFGKSNEAEIYIFPGPPNNRDSVIAPLYPDDHSYIFKLSDLIGDEFLYVN